MARGLNPRRELSLADGEIALSCLGCGVPEMGRAHTREVGIPLRRSGRRALGYEVRRVAVALIFRNPKIAIPGSCGDRRCTTTSTTPSSKHQVALAASHCKLVAMHQCLGLSIRIGIMSVHEGNVNNPSTARRAVSVLVKFELSRNRKVRLTILRIEQEGSVISPQPCWSVWAWHRVI